MFLQTLNAVLTLDIAFFERLVMGNLLWVGIFAAVMVLFLAVKKDGYLHLFTLIIMLYAFENLQQLLGWKVSGMMQFSMIAGNIAIFAWTDNETVSKNESILCFGLFWALWLVFNLVF